MIWDRTSPVSTFQIGSLASRLADAEDRHAAALASLPPAQQASARNLIHYVALRQHDLSPLQEELTGLGLSSLGWREAQVLDSVHAVLRLLRRLQSPLLARRGRDAVPGAPGQRTRAAGETHPRPARQPADQPPGAHPRDHAFGAAGDPHFVRNCLARGMDCMRINCAHDDAVAWERMITHLRQAQRELGVTAGSSWTWPAPNCAPGRCRRGLRWCAGSRDAMTWGAGWNQPASG